MSNTPAPAKIAQFLTRATERGLLVKEKEAVAGEVIQQRSWRISSPVPHEDTQIWIIWTAGDRSGTTSICRYQPFRRADRRRRATVTLTRQQAWIWLGILAQSVDWHNEREAAAKQAAQAEDEGITQ